MLHMHEAVGKRVDGLSGDQAELERKSRIYPVTRLTLPARHSRQESQTMAELQPEHCAAQSSPRLQRGGVKHSSPLLINPQNRMLQITKSQLYISY